MTVHLKDKKITLLHSVTDGTDDLGQPISRWEPLPGGANIWTYYRQTSGQEYYAAAAVQSEVDAVFEINWRDDLNTYMLVEFRGKRYNIVRIDDFEGYREGLKLYVKTAAAVDQP